MATAFPRSNSNVLSIVALFAVLVSFSIIYPTHSYIIPRHSLSSCKINEAAIDTAYTVRRIHHSKSTVRIDPSTRLHLSYQPQSPEDGKEANTGSKANGTTADSNTKDDREPTLYEILGASRTATRSELKQQYVKLARVSHPDAQIGGTGSTENDVDFQKVAEAWRTLGNAKFRKRYDRELKAKEWGEKAQRFTNEGLEQVAPVASKIMDNVAVPFLRRTSATIAFGKNIASNLRSISQTESDLPTPTTPPQQPSATIETEENDAMANEQEVKQAIANTNTNSGIDVDETDRKLTELNVNQDITEDVVNGNQEITEDVVKNSVSEQKNDVDTITQDVDNAEFDVDSFIATTIEAGKRAGKSPIDTSNDLNDKSLELEYRAKEEEEKAKYISEELDSVKKQRIFGTLQSSELTLTSKEAEEVLEELSSEDAVSFVSRDMKKAAIEKEIQSLRNTENQFTENLETYNKIDREWSVWLTKQEEAKKNLSEKRKEEIEARKAFDNAQQMVVKAKDDMVSASNTLRGVEQEVRKSAEEMDRVSTTLSKKQERVRNALRRKTELMKGGIHVEYITEQEVMSLRRKEIQLMGESQQIATMVARLQSRADKLKKRAELLEQSKK
ncbi:unnamed protein product [Pseudo-nitzschia multistriata]|uniref:J domain-containing protein n=1 Tax=Pseudo-nitzschia multistriata TaxID=183589 RepID=A0A448YXR8_9STRA|nr:unnamed protein product [Pseudo-nitzschia multistriata]